MTDLSNRFPSDPIQLAIETTGRLGSLALLKGSDVLRHINLSPSARTAATLTPELDEMQNWCTREGLSIDLVSVAEGPGSFTGLRIGVTTAKTFCYALSIPLVAIDSLAAVAAAAFASQSEVERLLIALDAYRNQVFVADFERDQLLPPIDQIPSDWFDQNRRSRIVQADQLATIANELSSDHLFVAGDERALKNQSLQDQSLQDHTLADRTLQKVERDCDAVGVGLLGLRAARNGNFIDPLSLIPRYLKASAAEEQANRRS